MTSQNKKHIALFIPSLRGGGAERVTYILANGIAKKGWCVDLVLAKARGVYLSDVNPQVRIVDLNASRTIFTLPRLVRYLQKEKPDHLLSALNHANVIALVARLLSPRPIQVSVVEHNTLSKAQPTNLRGKLTPFLMRLCYPFADNIIAVSQSAADDLAIALGLPRKKIQAIYNPIFDDTLLEKSNEEVNEPLLLDHSTPKILAVGRLTKQKDYQTLLKAFQILRNKQQATLIILGDGELRDELEAMVKVMELQDDVHMPGFVSNPYKWMKNCDIFVLSSLWEGLPTVLVEAMACGIPVVSTNCESGPAEILENGKYGKLVPVGDYQALTEAMEQVLAQRRTDYLDYLKGKFSQEKIVEEYCKLFTQEL